MSTPDATLTTDVHSLVAISFTINETFSVNKAAACKEKNLLLFMFPLT
jgi:hypothetical protein